MLKTCYTCKTPKKLDEFHNNKTKPDGKHGICKECRSHESKTPEFRKNFNAKRKLHYEANRRRFQEYPIKQRYGITLDDYDNMLKSQNGLCAICQISNTNFQRRFAIDHCHKTGKIRALLCANCNTGLGKFKDNPNFLQEAINYLALHS